MIKYSLSGMRDWLVRAGFCYNKSATIPGKLSPEKQAAFMKEYEGLRDTLPENEKIYFIDAVHCAYQSQSVCGWILKGKQKHLPTTAKQHRLHYAEAIKLSKGEKRT